MTTTLFGTSLSANPSQEDNKRGTKTRTVIICSLIVCSVLCCAVCAVVTAYVVQRKRQVLRLKEGAKLPSEDNWEVERADVTIGAELGSGCFGTVYKGTLKDSRQV